MGETSRKRARSRVTVGLLAQSIADPRERSIWSGAADAAQDRDVNLLCFLGGGLRGMGSAIYDLASAERLDGLMIALDAHRGGLTQLGERYRGMPVVSLAGAQDGVVGVTVEAYRGMRDAVQHLLERHGCRQIAFLRGREDSVGTEDLYRAYADALCAHGLSVNPALVVSGNPTRLSGVDMIRLLMEDRREQFDAIVCSSDYAALGVLEALAARGVRVPEDVLVVASGDAPDARFSAPTLTTAWQPWYEQGWQAVEVLLSVLDGEAFPEGLVLQSRLVVRQSCGCESSTVGMADADEMMSDGEASDDAGRSGFGKAISRRVWEQQALREGAQAEDARRVGQALVSTFGMAELSEVLAGSMSGLGIDGCFLSRYASHDGPGPGWSRLVVALRQGHEIALDEGLQRYRSRQLLPDGIWPTDRSCRMVIEPLYFEQEQLGFVLFESDPRMAWLCDRMRVYLSTAIKGALLTEEGRALEQALVRERSLLQSLVDSSPDLIYFKDAASRYVRVNRAHAQLLGLIEPRDAIGKTDFDLFPRQDAQRFYDEEQQILRSGEPVVGREWGVPAHTGDVVWVSEHKIPIKDDRGRVVGLVGLARDVSERRQFEAALERQLLQLQTVADVARAASGVVDPEALMQQVVDLVCDRLGLYYVGLFLVDETGEWTGEPRRWAVLQAGTGQAGRQMTETGHKLEVGGGSMVGSCIALSQGRIALDVGQEAARFDNPLLPYTRSELALPLVSRGQSIGAMTIQSTRQGAFSETDITILQAMADQLANAIQTARLLQQTQRTLAETEALYAVGRAVGRRLELEEVLKEALRQVLGLAGFDAGLVSIADRDTGRLSLAVGQDLPTAMVRNLRQAGLDGTLCDLVYRQGEVLALEDMSHGAPIDAGNLLRMGFRSCLGVPLGSRGEVVGTLCVFGCDTVAVRPSLLSLMEAMGQQIGGAIANVRLFAEMEDRARRQAAIGRVSEEMQRAPDMPSLARIAAEELRYALGASRAYVRLGNMSGLGEDEE